MVVVGLLWPWLSKLRLGRVAGDIATERGNFTLLSSILVLGCCPYFRPGLISGASRAQATSSITRRVNGSNVLTSVDQHHRHLARSHAALQAKDCHPQFDQMIKSVAAAMAAPATELGLAERG
jgi:hypothetical protein